MKNSNYEKIKNIESLIKGDFTKISKIKKLKDNDYHEINSYLRINKIKIIVKRDIILKILKKIFLDKISPSEFKFWRDYLLDRSFRCWQENLDMNFEKSYEVSIAVSLNYIQSVFAENLKQDKKLQKKLIKISIDLLENAKPEIKLEIIPKKLNRFTIARWEGRISSGKNLKIELIERKNLNSNLILISINCSDLEDCDPTKKCYRLNLRKFPLDRSDPPDIIDKRIMFDKLKDALIYLECEGYIRYADVVKDN